MPAAFEHDGAALGHIALEDLGVGQRDNAVLVGGERQHWASHRGDALGSLRLTAWTVGSTPGRALLRRTISCTVSSGSASGRACRAKRNSPAAAANGSSGGAGGRRPHPRWRSPRRSPRFPRSLGGKAPNIAQPEQSAELIDGPGNRHNGFGQTRVPGSEADRDRSPSSDRRSRPARLQVAEPAPPAASAKLSNDTRAADGSGVEPGRSIASTRPCSASAGDGLEPMLPAPAHAVDEHRNSGDHCRRRDSAGDARRRWRHARVGLQSVSRHPGSGPPIVAVGRDDLDSRSRLGRLQQPRGEHRRASARTLSNSRSLRPMLPGRTCAAITPSQAAHRNTAACSGSTSQILLCKIASRTALAIRATSDRTRSATLAAATPGLPSVGPPAGGSETGDSGRGARERSAGSHRRSR